MRKLVVVLTFFGFVVASCTPAGTGTTSSNPSASAAPLPQKITIVGSAEPSTLDALHESGTALFSMISQNIMETLVSIDSDTRKVTPVLVTDWKEAGTTAWRITIRSGVKFHDGTSLTAEDVIASLDYALAQGSPFQSYVPYGGARKVDSSTIEITTTRADPLLPVQLQFVSVAPATAISKGKDFMATNGIGTGPYKVVAWTKGQSLTLARFDAYWGAAPPIKDVTYVWRTEPSVRANMVRTGEAQLAQALSASDVQDMPKVQSVPGLAVYTLFMNTTGQTKGSIMSDQRVRLAVNYAVDRVALRDKIYGGHATLVKGNMVPPVVLGFNDQLTDYPYDPQKAKDLISQAGATGKAVTFVCPNGTFVNVVEACQLIAAQLNQVGLAATVTSVAFTVWLDTYRNGPKGLDRPDIMIGTPADETLDMSSKVAPTYFRSYQAGGGGGAIADSQLEAMVAAAALEVDQAKRQQLEAAISKYVYDKAYVAPLLAPNYIWGMTKNVDYKPLPNQNLFLSTIKFNS